MEEKELIRRCIAGENKAQIYLYTKYKGTLYGTCRRYVLDSQFAEDTLISGFTKIYMNLTQYKGNGSFEGWMRKIVVNECLMFLRKSKKRINDISIDNTENFIQIPDNIDIVSDITTAEILRLIKQLPQGYRTIFNLYIIEGYKHREIAEMLDISINTSKSQLILARKKLISIYKKHYT